MDVAVNADGLRDCKGTHAIVDMLSYESTMSDQALLGGLINGLSVVVFRRESEGYRSVGPVPAWYTGFAGTASGDMVAVPGTGTSDFLEHFLVEAQEFWRTHESGHHTSGIWNELGRDGADYHLEALALAVGRAHVLLLRQVGGANVPIQQILQTARERDLQHHQDVIVHERVEHVLGGMLETSERVRDDLVAILDQLQLGTMMTDVDGQVTLLSQAACRLLGLDAGEAVGAPWRTMPVWTSEHIDALETMMARPAAERQKVSVVLESEHSQRVALEVDIQEDPRDAQRSMFFLYDVTEVHGLRALLTERNQFFDLIGKSPAMEVVFQRIREIATVDVTVLIEGETGTGKELVARALHQASPRSSQPFVAVNCAGLTDSLLGSQLFGHRRGAFTGAMHDHQGFFEAADGGTLFLDEIGDMPLNIQTTLLRALQEKEIIRLGESKPRRVDVRVITATHQDLTSLVETGQFRSDLLYRIRVARVHLPPLRLRREDIPLLCAEFFAQSRVSTKKFEVQEVSTDAMRQLMKYGWPGNVRELRSALDYALIHCQGPLVLPSDLPPECLYAPAMSPLEPDGDIDEKEYILTALKRAKGKRAVAARLLGMSRSTLYRRLDSLGIVSKEGPGESNPSALE